MWSDCREKRSTFSHHICRIVVLVILWAVFFFIIYWTFTAAQEIEQWDPYEILGLSEVGTINRTGSGSVYVVSMATGCIATRQDVFFMTFLVFLLVP